MARKKDWNLVKSTLSLTKETTAMLDKIAQENNLNRSQAVNKVITEYVEAKQMERRIGRSLREEFLKGENREEE